MSGITAILTGKVEWKPINKKTGEEVYISFSEKGDYEAKIDILKEFSGKGKYIINNANTKNPTIVVTGNNVNAAISNIKFINKNSIEATITNNGVKISIRAFKTK